MKRLLRLFIITSTLTIPCMLPLQTHAELRSPCILTESEQAMITELIRMHKNSHPDQKDARECIVFGAHTILIRYEDGHIGLFDTGDAILLDKKQEASSGIKAEDKSREVAIPHTGTEYERELFTELNQIWQSVPSPDDLSPEQLARADELVEQFVSTVPSNEIQLATYNSLGLRGGRYSKVIEHLPFLSSEALIAFYEGYIGNSVIYSRTEDMPPDSDKQVIAQKLVHIFQTMEQGTVPLLPFDISQEIKRIDPDSYAQLKQRGAIMEDNQ